MPPFDTAAPTENVTSIGQRQPAKKGLIVDLFAGGGGMGKAIQIVFGRSADIACNHSPDAVSMSRLNHPNTRIFQCDVYEVDPRAVCRGQPVNLLHLSPDCTHFSQAAGGQPRSKKIRGLSWVALRWLGQVPVDVCTLENVKQIRDWGPLVAKRDPATGRVVTLDLIACPTTGKSMNRVADPGEHVPVARQYLVPDKRRAGQTWRRFKTLIRNMGYVVDETLLVAADYGAATTRERLMFTARSDGKPIGRAERTHHRNPGPGERRWPGAAEHLDFSLECPSIFTRKKELAVSTKRRTARGAVRYVLQSGEPFIIPTTHHGDARHHPVSGPVPTITAAHRGELMLVSPSLLKIRGSSNGLDLRQPLPTLTSGAGARRPAGHPHAMGIIAPLLVQASHGEGKPGGVQRWGHGSRDATDPIGTLTGSCDYSVAQPQFVPASEIASGWMVQHNTMPNGGVHPGHDLRHPASTLTGTVSHQGLATANLVQLRNNCDGRDVTEPLRTLSAGGEHHGLVRCELSLQNRAEALRVADFLIRYHGETPSWPYNESHLESLSEDERLDLVSITVNGQRWLMVNIGLRMLTPAEAYGCQGFPPDYIIDRGHDGKAFSKSAQFKMCGNSVPPPMGAAHLHAQFPELQQDALVEAA